MIILTDADFLAPTANQCILTSHIEALSRAGRETGIINGNRLTASTPADMVVTIGAGRIKIAGTPADVAEDTVTLDAAHATLPRIDIIYRDAAGDAKAAKGTPATIEDPKGLSDWKSYTSPMPPSSIPPGAIIGAIWIPAECTAITSEYIWMFAGGVGDLATTVDSPGVDARAVSEKAIRACLDARILHSLATAANDFLVASGSGIFVKKTLAEVKTILGLGTAAYTASADYAVTAKGVTNGDSHDHSGGDGAQINHAYLSNIGSNTHADIDSFMAQKAAGSGLASLNSSLKVVQDPANATTTPTAGKIPIADVDGKLTSWIPTRAFDIAFPFGDGSALLAASACTFPAPRIACKIVSARIRSLDATGAPLSGSITCKLYKHSLSGAIGTIVDTFALASATNMEETGLNIAVSSGDWLTLVISGIVSCKQIVCSVSLEAT